MATAADNPRSRLATSWQIPAFGLALLAFVAGLMRAVGDSPRPVAIDPQRLLSTWWRQGEFEQAANHLSQELKSEHLAPARRAELHALLAKTYFLAETRRAVHSPANLAKAIQSHEKAVAEGYKPDAAERLMLARGLEWAERYGESADVWRELLEAGTAESPDAVRRMLATWIAEGRVNPQSGEPESLIEAVLVDAGAKPANRAWALERCVEGLLANGDVAGARRRIDLAAAKLAATPYADLAVYLRGVCLVNEGSLAEAEQSLRALRSRWQPRDELWANTTRMLGEIHNREDRPQIALGYFDEVLKAYRTGAVREASLLGRAESLLALDRYTEAATALEPVIESLSRAGGAVRGANRAAVRAFVRTAARRVEAADVERFAGEAARFLELGAQLLDDGDRQEAAYLHERIGDLRALVARQRGAAGAKDEMRAASLAASAGYAAMMRDLPGNEPLASRALDKALEVLSLADAHAEKVRFLREYLAAYPQGAGVPSALRRLAEALRGGGRCDEAIPLYRDLLHRFARTVDASESIVPLAQCLSVQDESGRDEAVALLIDFLDSPPERDSSVTPQAPAYRAALHLVAELHRDRGEWELAIRRLEDLFGFYPNEPQAARLRFALGDCYRRSGVALAGELAASKPAELSPIRDRESKARLMRAKQEYDRVVAELAAADETKLSDEEKAYLRAAYMHRADCLFQVGQYGAALAGYTEALWRYEREPTGVAAALQVVHCQIRIGRLDDARRSLERARWLLERVPEAAFAGEPGMPERSYWAEMIEQVAQTGLTS